MIFLILMIKMMDCNHPHHRNHKNQRKIRGGKMLSDTGVSIRFCEYTKSLDDRVGSGRARERLNCDFFDFDDKDDGLQSSPS